MYNKGLIWYDLHYLGSYHTDQALRQHRRGHSVARERWDTVLPGHGNDCELLAQ